MNNTFYFFQQKDESVETNSVVLTIETTVSARKIFQKIQKIELFQPILSNDLISTVYNDHLFAQLQKYNGHTFVSDELEDGIERKIFVPVRFCGLDSIYGYFSNCEELLKEKDICKILLTHDADLPLNTKFSFYISFSKHGDGEKLFKSLQEIGEFWSNSVAPLLLDISTSLSSLQIPPYILLEIIDWIPSMIDFDHKNKIDLLYAVQKSILNK